MQAWDPETVRAEAAAELAPWGIVVPDHLPRLTLGAPRPVTDVIGRAQALHGVLDIIHGESVDGTYAAVAAFGADRWISTTERAYLTTVVEGDPDVDAEYRLGWRSESLYALAWILGIAPGLPLTRRLELRPEHFQPLDPRRGPAPPLDLRPVEEIAAKLDVLFCAHWAARDQEGRGLLDEWPEDLDPDALWERRRALEWFLLPGVEWDDVRLDA
jgi:hypothetical protein